MRPLLVCIHDVTPAFASEIELLLCDLASLVGNKLALGVVPNWHNQWPLSEHADFCAMMLEGSDELLLHGYSHHRQRGYGPVSWLAESSDEMNGLSALETRVLIAMGQRDMSNTFGQSASGFLAPAWQQGHVRRVLERASELEYTMGFFSLESRENKNIPLATFTWDCGRWSALGHAGHAIGLLLHSLSDLVPVLAIHPRDLRRGYGAKIVRLLDTLVTAGYEPATPSELLELRNAEVTL